MNLGLCETNLQALSSMQSPPLFSPAFPSPLLSSSPLPLTLLPPPLLPLPFLSPLFLCPSPSLFHFSLSLSLSLIAGAEIPLCPLALAALRGSVGFILDVMASTSEGFQAGRRQGWAERLKGKWHQLWVSWSVPLGWAQFQHGPGWSMSDLESHRPGLRSPIPR